MKFFILIYSIISLGLYTLLHHFLYKKAKYFKINKANQRAIRWSSQKKPIAGGITFFLSFLFATIFFLISEPNNIHVDAQYFYITMTLIFAFLIGLADDMLSVSPHFKLIFQILIATLLIYAGLYIKIFDNNWLNYMITVIWYVGMMNSINMLDNMDAISTVVGITILLEFIFINMIVVGNLYELLILLAVLFSLITFLLYNLYPAKMYMGDNGSLFLGLFVAIFGVQYLWNHPIYQSDAYYQWLPFIFILLTFLIPLTDTTTVTINRLLNKKSPFIGGRDHTTHALSRIGLSENKVAILLFLLNLVGTSFATYFIVKENYNPLLIGISIFYCTFVVLFLYINAYRVNRKNKAKNLTDN